MATVISNDSVDMHSVDKYKFKVIAIGSKNEASSDSSESVTTERYTEDNNPRQRATDIDSSAMSTSSKESLIESLMKKTDEMSSNFIKLQMKLEAKDEEFKEELQKAKEEAFNDGMEAGRAKAIEDGEIGVSEAITLFSASVKKLDESAKEFEKALEGIKESLVAAALDISKEVINVELSENSAEVAQVLAGELIKELQSASRVTLKVNPKDHGEVSQKLGKLEYVEIISDSAISQGGVVAMSDAGNIDAEISKRFERVKRAALSE
jgi:flagellar assembly protein FliH